MGKHENNYGEIEFELLDETLEVQKSYQGRWCKPLKMFLKSGKGTIVFKCKTKEEQSRGITAIQSYNRKYNLNLVAGRHGSTEIYVVRA